MPIAAQLHGALSMGLLSPLEVECSELLGKVKSPCRDGALLLKGGGEPRLPPHALCAVLPGRENLLNSGYRWLA